MNHAIFSGIPVVAIGLALSAELKVAVAMIGHEEQLFLWVWCRKTPASVCSGPLGESMKLSQPGVFVRLVRGQKGLKLENQKLGWGCFWLSVSRKFLCRNETCGADVLRK